MSNEQRAQRPALRLAAALLLGGQIAYIAITQFHAGGHANEHHDIFETYAHDQVWGAVHLGQFGAMAVLLGGLIALAFALDVKARSVRWFSRFGAVAATVALALHGVLQAVDGVALKQAVSAWASAPEAEQAARFAVAESIRWLEWGTRSYQDYAFGMTLLSFAAALLLGRQLPRALGLLFGLSGLAYLAQGWIAGSEGFSAAQSVAIVLGWLLSLASMLWLAAAAWRGELPRPSTAVGLRAPEIK